MRTDAHGNIRRGKVSRSFKIEVQELPLPDLAEMKIREQKEKEMEKREIDPEKRREVQKTTTRAVLIITAVIVIYVVYALITKNLNIYIFEGLLMLFVVAYVVLNDFLEPYRLGIFEGMTVGQKSGFMKILVLDAVGIGAVLYWIIGMGNSENVNQSIFPLLIYILTAQMKRRFRPEFEGTDQEEGSQSEEEALLEEEPLSIEAQDEDRKEES